jgi:hypothetical protein
MLHNIHSNVYIMGTPEESVFNLFEQGNGNELGYFVMK